MSFEGRNSKLKTQKLLSQEKWSKLEQVLKPLSLTDEILEKLMNEFKEQMHLANSPDENIRKKSDLLMMNTFIRILLDGTEQGDYLGLDLGGTNFRVVLVRFKDGVADTTTQYYELTDETLSGPSAGVFDFIAESVQDFLLKQGLANSKEKIPAGFTFSFPSTQLELNKSILLTWTKTFKCPDGVGEDPVAMLEAAIQRKAKDLPVDVVVVLNDTVGTLMAGNYLDKKCRVGLGIGTGSNAAFVENISDIEKWTGDYEDPKHVIVNVELGSTGDNGCMDFYRSEYEKEIDKFSNFPGSYTFEKSFSGLYLGEFVRLVLVRLIKDGTLFNGQGGKLVDGRWEFTTSHVTSVESDVDDSTTNTKNVLKKFDLDSVATEEDIVIVREVCEFISYRGAYIIAAVMSVLINYVSLPEVTIGVDGSIYERHPKFHNSMMEVFEKFSPQTKVKMILAKDGSGQGAAFAAVSALRQMAKGLRCS
ncbi:hexokinase-1-like [Physella acuta]|uniref:hexokinase-1-like n=1 Tax=Physella acuta TaxID=109671 RepID=UPI0027DEA687|nr:hexokinase-1-like [Physella acuta]XP_059162252.1 hexokinase-1-like [Physella acuta]